MPNLDASFESLLLYNNLNKAHILEENTTSQNKLIN